MMTKNFLFYAFSTFINNFAAEKGPGHMCRIFGTVTVVGFLTCVPMCEYFSMFCRCCSALSPNLSLLLGIWGEFILRLRLRLIEARCLREEKQGFDERVLQDVLEWNHLVTKCFTIKSDAAIVSRNTNTCRPASQADPHKSMSEHHS